MSQTRTLCLSLLSFVFLFALAASAAAQTVVLKTTEEYNRYVATEQQNFPVVSKEELPVPGKPFVITREYGPKLLLGDPETMIGPNVSVMRNNAWTVDKNCVGAIFHVRMSIRATDSSKIPDWYLRENLRVIKGTVTVQDTEVSVRLGAWVDVVGSYSTNGIKADATHRAEVQQDLWLYKKGDDAHAIKVGIFLAGWDPAHQRVEMVKVWPAEAVAVIK